MNLEFFNLKMRSIYLVFALLAVLTYSVEAECHESCLTCEGPGDH